MTPLVQPFVHQATLSLKSGADRAAPGGAVTLALCGVWDHDGRCRWPHHSGLHLVRATAVLRTVFVSVPVEEQLVRARIDAQLGIGTLTGPDGRTSSWRLRDTRAADPDPDEAALGVRLVSG